MNHLQRAVQRMKKETLYDGKKLLLRLDPFDEDSFHVYEPLEHSDDVYSVGTMPLNCMPDSIQRLLKQKSYSPGTTVVAMVVLLDFFTDYEE